MDYFWILLHVMDYLEFSKHRDLFFGADRLKRTGCSRLSLCICYSRCASDKSVLPAATLSLPAPKNKSITGRFTKFEILLKATEN